MASAYRSTVQHGTFRNGDPHQLKLPRMKLVLRWTIEAQAVKISGGRKWQYFGKALNERPVGDTYRSAGSSAMP
jgi:uncharacterized protein (UPF0128 family)